MNWKHSERAGGQSFFRGAVFGRTRGAQGDRGRVINGLR